MEQITQFGSILRSFLTWVRDCPLQAFLLCAVTGTVVYFSASFLSYANQSQPIWEWAWLRFLPQYNQEHSNIAPGEEVKQLAIAEEVAPVIPLGMAGLDDQFGWRCGHDRAPSVGGKRRLTIAGVRDFKFVKCRAGP